MLKRLFKQANNASDRHIRQTERQIAQYYAKALDEIQNELARYNRKGQLTQTQMLQRNRLQNLEKQISKEIAKVTGGVASTLKARLGQLYEEVYYRTGFAFERTVKVDLSYSLLDKRIVQAVIESPFDRIGWLQRNRTNQAQLTAQLKQEIFTGLTRGDSYQKIAKTVKDRMQTGNDNVIRIVRTEGQRIRNMAKMDSMYHAESEGVKQKKMWVATLGDGRTRDSHEDLDGVTLELDEEFVGDNGEGMAPGLMNDVSENVNCRCTMISIIEGYTPKVRRIKGEGVQEYQTYREWKKNRLK